VFAQSSGDHSRSRIKNHVDNVLKTKLPHRFLDLAGEKFLIGPENRRVPI